MSVDDKGNHKKDDIFDLLAHEKKISELYQNNKALHPQEPSAQLNVEIMAMAKKQLSENASLVAKDRAITQQLSAHKNTHNKIKKTWQGPFSLVASVGILGILFITQRDYFMHPNNIAVRDAGISNGTISQAPNIKEEENSQQETAAVHSFQDMTSVASTQKYQVLLDSNLQLNKKLQLNNDKRLTTDSPINKDMMVVARKNKSNRETPEVLTEKTLAEKVLGNSILEDSSVKIPPISLLDIAKMAASLKIDLATQNKSELETGISRAKMQQTLFEHLIRYQKSHADFKITEKYLNVLTENQRQQLK